MENLTRLNFKYLIADQGKKKELFQKLKPGETVNARVHSYEKGKALINIKGTDILTTVNRELKKGELVKLKIEEIGNDRLLMSVQDKEVKSKDFKNISNKNIEFQEKILSQALNEKIYLDEEKIKNIISKYEKYNEKFQEKPKELLRALIFLEANEVKESENLIENLIEYINETDFEKIKEEEDIKEFLKKAIEKPEIDDNKTKKGQDLLNSINKMNEKNEIEFITGFYNENEKAKIKIKYEEKGKDGKIKPENVYISIKLDLEKIGEIEIKISIWKKKIDLIFVVEEEIEKKEILKNIEDLKERVKKTGFDISDVRVKNNENKEYKIKGVNLKG